MPWSKTRVEAKCGSKALSPAGLFQVNARPGTPTSSGNMTQSARVLMALVAAAILTATSAGAAEAPDVAAGRAIAQRYCGGCHAVTTRRSPFRDAPPFRSLYRRYKPGHLYALLQEGMLPSDQPGEEADQARHPRMPTAPLGPDEAAELRKYLESLDPRQGQSRSRR